MDTEAFNPFREFKHFRPRQASRATKTVAAPTNHATISLFNNSSGPSVLVVRDFEVQGTANDFVTTSYVVGQPGTAQGLVVSMVSGEPLQAGLIASIDTATVYPGDYSLNLSSLGTFEWYHDWPYAVVTPGFSLVFQAVTVAHATMVSVVFETIGIDQLDFYR